MSQQNDSSTLSRVTAEAIEEFRLVRQDASDQFVYCDAGETPIGCVESYVASGFPACANLLRSKAGTQRMVAAGPIAKYADVYSAADGKIDDTKSGCRVGQALEAATANGDVIEVLPFVEKTDLKYANTAASAEVENTTVETAFDVKKTLAGAELSAGDVIRVRGQGTVIDNNSTDTLTVKLYLGTEEIVTTGAVDVADGDIFYIDCDIVVRIAGAGGHVAGCGVVALGVPGTVTAKPFAKADAAEDLSGNVDVVLKATWSVAHADNEVQLDNLIVEVLPKS